MQAAAADARRSARRAPRARSATRRGSRRPRRRARTRPSRSTVRITATAAAQASGPPPNVEPWSPGSNTSARGAARIAPIGNTAAERLGDRHDIRRRVLVLVRPPPAGASHPGLDLVEDEQHVALVAEPADRGEPARARAGSRRSHLRSARASPRTSRRRSPAASASRSSYGTCTNPFGSGSNGLR